MRVFRAYLSRIRANFGEKFDFSFYERWKGTLSIEHIRTVSEVLSDICGWFQFNTVDKLSAISWVKFFNPHPFFYSDLGQIMQLIRIFEVLWGIKSDLLIINSWFQGESLGGLDVLVRDDVKRCPHEIVQKRGWAPWGREDAAPSLQST